MRRRPHRPVAVGLDAGSARSPPMAFRSAPAQKVPPSPHSTATLASPSASKSRKAAPSASAVGAVDRVSHLGAAQNHGGDGTRFLDAHVHFTPLLPATVSAPLSKRQGGPPGRDKLSKPAPARGKNPRDFNDRARHPACSVQGLPWSSSSSRHFWIVHLLFIFAVALLLARIGNAFIESGRDAAARARRAPRPPAAAVRAGGHAQRWSASRS